MTTTAPEYRHATSDLWEAAALWAHGAVISHTERDGDRVVFRFALATGVAEASQLHRRGDLHVPSLLMREGYYQVRAMVDHGSRYDRHR